MLKELTRRQFLRLAGMGAALTALGACTKIVKETVEIEKIVKETVEVEKVVKETVEVEKVVTKEVEKVVTQVVEKAAPVSLRGYTYSGDGYPDGTTVTYMAGMSTDQKRGFVDDAAWLKQATNIDLVVEQGDDAKFNALLAAGTPPDLYYADTPGIRAADGTWLAIDEYVDPEFMSRYPQSFIDGFTGLDGKLYGMQLGGWFPWAWVNVKMLQDAGVAVPETDLTWDDVVTIGTQLTKDVNGKAPADSGFDAENVDVWGAWLGWFSDDILCFSNGASRYDETHTKFLMDDPKVIEAWKFWADLTCTHKIMPSSTWLGAAGTGAGELFINSKLAIYTDGISMDFCRRAEETLGTGNWKLVGFPHPASHDLVLSRYQGGAAVSSKTADPAAAVEALTFLASAGSMWYPNLWLNGVDYVSYWEQVDTFLTGANFRETFEYSLPKIGPEPWNGTAAPFNIDRYTQGWDFSSKWSQVRDCSMPFEEFDFAGYTKTANEKLVEGMAKDLEQAQLLPAWKEALQSIYDERKAEIS